MRRAGHQERKREAYFFGCWSEKGHYLYDEHARTVSDRLPWFEAGLDGSFQPRPEQWGSSRLWWTEGPWTVFAFWDRTVDGRPSSCAAFVLEGILTRSDCYAIVAKRFPAIWSRVNGAYHFEDSV